MAWHENLLCFQVLSITRRVSRYYNNQLAGLGITQSQSFVLFSLLKRDGLIMQELAERLQTEKPVITGIIDRLIGLNLVERRTTEENRRIVRAFLTPEGRQTAEKALVIASETDRRLAQDLSGEVILSLEVALTKLEKGTGSNPVQFRSAL